LNTQSIHGISPWERTHGSSFLSPKFPLAAW
jgi:hypothetical protein